MEVRSFTLYLKTILDAHPWKVFFSFLCVLAVVIFLLLKSKWGRITAIVFATVISAEAGLWVMRKESWDGHIALAIVAGSHLVNLLFDYVISVLTLKTPWLKTSVEIISEYGNIMIKKIGELIPWRKARSQKMSWMRRILHRILHFLNELHKRKSPWVYVIICASAGIPKVPIPLFPGWTAPAVFFIRYNRLGWVGWASLLLGMAFRTWYDFAIVYGFASLF